MGLPSLSGCRRRSALSNDNYQSPLGQPHRGRFRDGRTNEFDHGFQDFTDARKDYGKPGNLRGSAGKGSPLRLRYQIYPQHCRRKTFNAKAQRLPRSFFVIACFACTRLAGDSGWVDILSLSFIRNRRFSLRTGVIQVSPITALVLNGPWLRRKSLLINVIYEWSKITGSHRRHASPRDANNAISRPSEHDRQASFVRRCKSIC